MTRLKIYAAMTAFMIGAVLLAAPAGAWDRGHVDVLAVLPDVTSGVQSSVEGLTVGPDDNIYVPSFGFNTKGAINGNAVLFCHRPNWKPRQAGHYREFEPTHVGTRFQSGHQGFMGSGLRGRQGLES